MKTKTIQPRDIRNNIKFKVQKLTLKKLLKYKHRNLIIKFLTKTSYFKLNQRQAIKN